MSNGTNALRSAVAIGEVFEGMEGLNGLSTSIAFRIAAP
jgi:hypothetical protein